MEKLIDELKEVMLEELDAYKNMLEISKRKTDVITSGKVKDLDSITQIEQALIMKIGKLEDKREKIVENIKNQMGITNDLSITKLTSQLNGDNKKEITEIRDQLLNVLNEIKKRNGLNSTLIKDSLEYINFSLNLVANITTESTYSDKVKKENIPQQKSLFDAKV